MKFSALVLCLAAAVAAHAQTTAKPAAPAKPATAAKAAPAEPAAGVVKYPPGKKADPAVKKTLFALKIQDLKVGAGPEAAPMKLYKVKYTGWRAADGVVFDSWDQHGTQVTDKDGKPVMGDDGKPKLNAPEPASFPVGMGRMIPGFDQGFAGMHIGGIRRIFVPWQLGYGSRELPARADRPGIPSKSDLVFEVELISISELPAPPHPPTLPQGIPPGVPGGPAPPKPATPPPAAPPPSQPSTPPPPSQPSTPPPPQ